jgi:alkylated DNA repair dioxygenase AlkB
MQLSLLDDLRDDLRPGSAAPGFDPAFTGLCREWLDPCCWVDHLPGWVRGADALFDAVLGARKWSQRSRKMYEKRVLEPRLTDPWNLRSGKPLDPPLIEALRRALGTRYGVELDSVGFNYYRDGQDSVAWHGDRISREVAEPVVALVSLGEPRRFLLRPRGGGPSRRYQLGGGDLLVTGGRTQRDWEHSVPKVAQAGPRISLAFRHGMSPGAYGRVETPG